MITASDIQKNNPVLIVYPAGVGGEHIAHTLSLCSEEFEVTHTRFNPDVNQYHTICLFRYSSEIPDISDINTAIDSQYDGDVNNNLRIVLKDHPTERTLQFYSRHFNSIKTLFLTPTQQASIDYFSELAFKKLAVKVRCPINKSYVENEISPSLDQQQMQHIIKCANHYDWVWRHELHILNTEIRDIGLEAVLRHTDTLDEAIGHHKNELINTQYKVAEYRSTLQDCHSISVDDIAIKQNSESLWEQINKHVGSIDVAKATNITNTWINKNNELTLP